MKTKKLIELNKFNNFSSGELRVDKFYNYNPKEKLENSYGVKLAIFPLFKNSEETYSLDLSSQCNAITGIAFTKQYYPEAKVSEYRLIVNSEENYIYLHQFISGMNIMMRIPFIEFEAPPFIITCKKDDNDYIMMSSNEKLVVWRKNYSPYEITNVPTMTSMCYNDGILFCSIESPAYKIWYAKDWQFENIGDIGENSGYLILEDDIGDARKVLTFDEDVYVFRDYGITKIMNTKGELSVNQVYVSNTRIFPNTVCLCGNEIVFMTIDGIYSFNGSSVSKIDIDISKYLTTQNDNAYASSLGDLYYLALKLDFKDDKKVLCENNEYENNALLILNVNDGAYQILRGIDIKNLCPARCEEFEKMLVTFNGTNATKIGEIVDESVSMNEALPKYWLSQELTNSFNNKMFTKLSITADQGVKFNLMLDDENISFTTYQNGLNEFNFKLISKQIRLEISSIETSAKVDKVVLEYYEY